MDIRGKGLGLQGFYTPPDQLTEAYQADLADMNRPLSLEEFGGRMAEIRRQDVGPAEMASRLRLTARRLFPEDRDRLPRVIGDDNLAAQTFWQLSNNYPETQELVGSPEFQAVFGERFKSVGFIGRLWGNTVGAFSGGLRQGWNNIDISRAAYYEAVRTGRLNDPAFVARYQAWQAGMEEAALEDDNLAASSGWIMDLVREWGVNAGDMIGGMARAGMTWETLASTLAGAGIGAAVGSSAGGVGAVPGLFAGARQGAMTGISAAFGEAAAGESLMNLWESLPEDLKNEALSLFLPTVRGIGEAALERIGLGGMVHGAGSLAGRSLTAAASKVAPKTTARVSQALTGPGMAGRMTRFATGAAVHVLPEVATETLQEGWGGIIQRPYAREYAAQYPGRGITGPTWDEVGQAMKQAAWKTFWGGASVGLISPTFEFLTDPQGLKRLSPEQREALIDQTIKAAGAELALEEVRQGNESLRTNAKAVMEEMRKHPEFAQNPEATAALLAGISGGEKSAYVNARALQSLFQTALENEPGQAMDDIQGSFLDQLGISADQFAEALEDGTDLQVDLNALPAVINHPLADAMIDNLTVEPESVTKEMLADLESLPPLPMPLERADARVSDEARAEVEKSLLAAGRTKGQAKRETMVLTRMAGSLARITGVRPDLILGQIQFEKGDMSTLLASMGEGAAPLVSSLNQPHNPGLKLDQDVTVVRSSGKFAGRQVHELNKGKGRVELRNSIVGTYRNLDQGWDIKVGPKGVDHAINSSRKSAVPLAHLEAVASLPALIENAILVESHADRKGHGLKAVHRFFAPFDDGQSLFAVKLTVKDYGEGHREAEVDSVRKLYDLKIEKEMPEGIRQRHTSQLGDGSATGISSIKLNQLIENVKDNDGRSYLQSNEKGPRGRTDILPFNNSLLANYIVVFSPEADVSTAIHEFQHVFVDMAQNILALPLDQIADMDARNQLEADMKELGDWAGVKDGQWTVEAHEKAAQAFEQYFMEGKAPVKGLQGMFSRMKKYLLNIYKSLVSSGVPLIEISDDVRRVFDRQLATEEELALESGRNDSALDAEVLDYIHEYDPKLYDEYVETANRANEEHDRETIKFRNAEREKMIRRWQREGRKMAREDSRQAQLTEIKKRGISVESLEACGYDGTAIQALQNRHPGIITKFSQIGLDEMADEYGLTADEFFNELMNTPTIEEMAAAYVAAQTAFYDAEGYFDSVAPLTDAGVDLAEMELNIWAKYMARHGSKFAPKSSRDIQRRINRDNGIKNSDDIYAKDMADLRASYRAQIRAAKAGKLEGIGEGKASGYKSGVVEGYRASQALAKADLLQQRLELAVRFRDQARRQRDRQKAMAEFKRVSQQDTARQFKFGGILPSYHSQIKALLHNFGIGPEAQTEMSLADFIAQEKDRNAGIGAADWIVNGQWPVYTSGKRAGRRIPLQSLSESQFGDVKQAVANLTFLGRRQQKVMVGGQLQDLNRVVEELETAARANRDVKAPRSEQEVFEDDQGRKKFGGALFNFIDGFSAALLKTETICRVLDGGEYGGFWQRTIYEPINKAHHDTISRTKKLTEDLTALIEAHVGKKEMRKWRGNKVVIEGVPWTFTQEQLFMYIMSLGNSQNAKLVRNFNMNGDGNGITDVQHRAIMEAAPKEMYDLAQAIWDYQDHSMFPELDALTRRTTGLPLKKVEAESIDTPYGQYRGGYSPIVFDRRMSETAERLSAQRDSAQAAANRFRPGRTNAGATNERTGTTYEGLRARLSLDALANSWAENIYDLSYREATNDVKRLLADPRIRQTVSGAFSDQHLRQFDLWIQEMIAPGSERKSTIAGVDAALRAIRRNITTSAMGLKASVMLCQPSGIFQAMHKIGPVNTAIGITSFFTSLITGGKPFLDQLYQKSPELGARNDSGSHDRDISDSMSMRNPLNQTLRDKLDVVAFKPIAIMDQLTANSIWTGAYLDSKSKGQTEEAAIEYANSVVRTTQSTGASKDLSYVQRGMGYGDLGKIFTMFGTFFSASHNLFWEQYKLTGTDLKKGKYGQAAKGAGSALLYLALLPAIYDALLRDGIPEDDEDWERMGKGVTSYFVGGIPVVKDLVGRALGTSFRFQPAPILGTLDDMTVGLGTGIQKIAAGEDGGWTKTIRGLGGWTGLPTGQITTTMKGAEEWDEREGFDAFYRMLVRESPK